jgi:hypothetical protein
LSLALGGELLILRVGGVARELRFRLCEQRLVAQEVRLGLRERRFERPPIELEQLVLLDDIAFVEGDSFSTPVTCDRIGRWRMPQRCRSRRDRPARRAQ